MLPARMHVDADGVNNADSNVSQGQMAQPHVAHLSVMEPFSLPQHRSRLDGMANALPQLRREMLAKTAKTGLYLSLTLCAKSSD